MNARTKAAGVGFFVVVMLVLGIGMVMIVNTGSIFGEARMRYELVYDASVKGLETGSPVTLKGVQIGEVVSVKARFYKGSNTPLNAVVIDVYPGRVEFDDDDNREGLIELLISEGLGAKLKLQSLLTGLLYIEVDFYNSEPRTILVDTEFPQIPTVPSDMEKLNDFSEVDLVALAKDFQQTMANIREFTDSSDFKELPTEMNNMVKNLGMLTGGDDFQQLASNMNRTMTAVELASGKMGSNADSAGIRMDEAMASMEETMVTMSETAEAMNAYLQPDSPVIYKLGESLNSLDRAARSVEQLATMLEQQPNSILAGRAKVNP
ncbi:MlaD family protein [Parendozoicomonas sp. Alg238-R29]|uniref:MlaD family protein n=1 Tax=Parendozoicomonas sp. Alg238-R29 TaxID=2993446 RepID=UPI00248E4C15|nr:MlaD family protein [Parendozoicomonas sp. Alg238-R29]